MNTKSDVSSRDTQQAKSTPKPNRGQFREGSQRAREMGRLGGQRSSSSKKQKVRSQTSHPVIRGDE